MAIQTIRFLSESARIFINEGKIPSLTQEMRKKCSDLGASINRSLGCVHCHALWSDCNYQFRLVPLRWKWKKHKILCKDPNYKISASRYCLKLLKCLTCRKTTKLPVLKPERDRKKKPLEDTLLNKIIQKKRRKRKDKTVGLKLPSAYSSNTNVSSLNSSENVKSTPSATNKKNHSNKCKNKKMSSTVALLLS